MKKTLDLMPNVPERFASLEINSGPEWDVLLEKAVASAKETAKLPVAEWAHKLAEDMVGVDQSVVHNTPILPCDEPRVSFPPFDAEAMVVELKKAYGEEQIDSLLKTVGEALSVSPPSLFDTLLEGATGVAPKQLIAFARDRHPILPRVKVQSAMLRMLDEGLIVLTKDRLVTVRDRMSALGV